MDSSLESSSIVEEVDAYLPGSPLANRGPIIMKGRLPPKRMVKRAVHAVISKPPSVRFDGGGCGVSLDEDDDGFVMSPRFRRKVESANKRRSVTLTKGRRTSVETVLPPVKVVISTKKNNEVVPPTKPIGEQDERVTAQRLSLRQGRKVTPVNSLQSTISTAKTTITDKSIICGCSFKDYSIVDYDQILSPKTGANGHGKVDVSEKRTSFPAPKTVSLEVSTTSIVEDIDEYMPGSPFKRDLNVSAPCHVREPPKGRAKQGRCFAFSSILIPNLMFSGSTLDDTVDSSLVPHNPQQAKKSCLPIHQSKRLSTHPSESSKAPAVCYPTLPVTRKLPFASNGIGHVENTSGTRDENARSGERGTTKVVRNAREDSSPVDAVWRGNSSRKYSYRYSGYFQNGDANMNDFWDDGDDPLGVVCPRLRNKLQERRASRRP